MSGGLHLLMISEGSGEISVHLGPAWFLENQEFVIESGETLEVTGSRITFDGAPAIIARKVVKDDEELVLRDEAGYPTWSAARRRRGP